MSDQEFVDQVAEAITKALRQVSDVVGVSPPSDFDAHAAAEAAIAGLRKQMKKRNTCSCTCACCTVEPKWKPRVTHTRLSDGRVVPRGSQAAAIDQYGEGLVSYVADAGQLIEASSLGTPAARAFRESVSDEDVDRIMGRVNEQTAGKPMSKTEREAAEARFRAIHEECKGNVWKTLRAMPRAINACRDIYRAALKEALDEK